MEDIRNDLKSAETLLCQIPVNGAAVLYMADALRLLIRAQEQLTAREKPKEQEAAEDGK